MRRRDRTFLRPSAMSGAGLIGLVLVLSCQEGGNLSPLAVIADLPATIIDEDGDGSEWVVLDGGESVDPDGSIASFRWLENGVEIASGVSATVSLGIGAHTITLEVTDNAGAIATTDVTVDVIEPEPDGQATVLTADAGLDQDVVAGSGVQVVLEGSADGGSGQYRFHWTPESGVDDPTAAQPTALPTQTTVYTLTVTDSVTGQSATDTVTVTVVPAEPPLSADAGAFQFLAAAGNMASVSLEGSASSGLAPLSYQWSYVEGPALPQPPNIESAAQPSEFSLPIGRHVIRLTLTDASTREPVTDDVVVAVFLPTTADHNATPSTSICTEFEGNCDRPPKAFFTVQVGATAPLEPPSSEEGTLLVAVPGDQVTATNTQGTRYVNVLLESVLADEISVPDAWYQSETQIDVRDCNDLSLSEPDPTCGPPPFPDPFANGDRAEVLLSEGIHYIIHTTRSSQPEGADTLAVFEARLMVEIVP